MCQCCATRWSTSTVRFNNERCARFHHTLETSQRSIDVAYRFFAERRYPDLGVGKPTDGEAYINVSYTVGTLVSQKMATLYELQTVYSLEDALDLIEIMSVDHYNQRKAQKDG